MVKVDKDTLDYIAAEWDEPIQFDSDDEDESPALVSPSTTVSAEGPSLKMPAPLPENQGEIIKNLDLGTPPSKEVTGVDPAIVEICASLSNQIYDAYSKDYFHLEASNGDRADVLILDTHGNFNPAIPAFAVATVGSTMIMGWVSFLMILDIVAIVRYLLFA